MNKALFCVICVKNFKIKLAAAHQSGHIRAMTFDHSVF